jgi:phage baseplate assembly protein W
MVRSDVWITADGELEIGANGDLRVAYDADMVAQNILFRLKTVEGDFLLQPQCGASLESLIGQPNSAETGGKLDTAIRYALTHDNFIAESNLMITVMPISRNNIAAVVQVYVDDVSVEYVVDVDLKEGQVKYTRV